MVSRSVAVFMLTNIEHICDWQNCKMATFSSSDFTGSGSGSAVKALSRLSFADVFDV